MHTVLTSYLYLALFAPVLVKSRAISLHDTTGIEDITSIEPINIETAAPIPPVEAVGPIEVAEAVEGTQPRAVNVAAIPVVGPAGHVVIADVSGDSITSVVPLTPISPVEPVEPVEAVEPVPAGMLKIQVLNKHSSAIAVSILDNAGLAVAVADPDRSREIAPGDSTFYTVPDGWSGALPVVEAERGMSSHASLIELAADPALRVTHDVSYLTGYTVPIVCGCNENGVDRMVVGCNKDLLEMNGGSCPKGQSSEQGACINQSRGTDEPPPPFFQPCAEAAYIYEGAHRSQNGEACRNIQTLLCCAGSGCPPSENQDDYALQSEQALAQANNLG